MNHTDSIKEDHTVYIGSKKGWQLINFRELVEYRDLFYFLILKDIKALYKQTVLGFTWAIIRPVFSMIIFSVIFGNLAKIPSDGIPYPVFSYAALCGKIGSGHGNNLISRINELKKVADSGQ